MRPALLVILLIPAACGSSIGSTCDLQHHCGDGEVCDYGAPGGGVCLDAAEDADGDGLRNDKDFCHRTPGGDHDEDLDGIGDICDSCPIAAPRDTLDADGDAVESPCDPDPREPGDEILLFDPFTTLDARWTPTTASAWEVRGGEVVASLAGVAAQDSFSTVVTGRGNLSFQGSYRVDRIEASANQHLVAVFAGDPRPAGVADVQCGVNKFDGAAGELVVVETNQAAMNTPVMGAFETASLYRAGVYITGTRAGCSVIADGNALGIVQASITPDQLSSIALTARAVTVKFQWVLVTGR
jgi:hypothetical protein